MLVKRDKSGKKNYREILQVTKKKDDSKELI